MAITKLIGSYKKALVTNIRPKKLEKNAIFHDAVKRSRSTVNVFRQKCFGKKRQPSPLGKVQEICGLQEHLMIAKLIAD